MPNISPILIRYTIIWPVLLAVSTFLRTRSQKSIVLCNFGGMEFAQMANTVPKFIILCVCGTSLTGAEGSDTSWNFVQFTWNPKWNLESCLGIWNPVLRINLFSPGNFQISRYTTLSARII